MDAVVSVKAPSGAPIDLGQARAFGCGDLAVDPPARQIRGPLRTVMLEPRVMQLLVALSEAEGAVVSRERLVERCWGDVVVGDDSLNRAIAGLRRGLKDAGSRSVEVCTVPKVGYRLAAAASPSPPGTAAAASALEANEQAPSRRRILAGLAALAAGGVAGTGGWLLLRDGRRTGAGTEFARAKQLLLQYQHDADGEARALLEREVASDPSNSQNWGLLAVAWQQIADSTVPETLAEAELRSRDAAARALALDRLQGDAQAALALLEPAFGAWMATDERLRRVLEVAPDNVFAQQGMLNILMGSGRLRDARSLAEKAFGGHPESAVMRTSKVHLAWAEDGPGRALQLANELGSPNLRVSVMPWLLALAGRHSQGEALIAGIEARQRVPSRVLTAQRLTARALGTGLPDDAAAARDALLPLGAVGGMANFMAIGGLSGLGFLDDAFAVAERWYVGTLSAGDTPAGRVRRHATGTRILFLPITAGMRGDARFLPLCERIGLVAYWRQRGMRADALKDRLLPL